MEQEQTAQQNESLKVVTKVETPLDFFIYTLDKYIKDVIVQDYQQSGGMANTHLLILTRQLLYQPYVFKADKNTQIAINMIMQRLSAMENIIGYIVFSDIQDTQANQRKLHVAVYMKEGTMIRYYPLSQDDKYKHNLKAENHRDFWCQADEKILGFSNPFFKSDIKSQSDQIQIEQQVKQIQQSLRKLIKKHNKKNKVESEMQSTEVLA